MRRSIHQNTMTSLEEKVKKPPILMGSMFKFKTKNQGEIWKLTTGNMRWQMTLTSNTEGRYMLGHMPNLYN